MLCSARELALAEKSEGLLELDADGQPGKTPIASSSSWTIACSCWRSRRIAAIA